MTSFHRTAAALIGLAVMLLAVLVPTVASAAPNNWESIHYLLVFDDDTYAEGSSTTMETTLYGQSLHLSCSDVLYGTTFERDGETIEVVDYYIFRRNGAGEKLNGGSCGDPELQIPEEPELCPEGTDHAGTPTDQVEACDDEVEVCPDGTDHAGTPTDQVEACDEPSVDDGVGSDDGDTDDGDTDDGDTDDDGDGDEEPEVLPEVIIKDDGTDDGTDDESEVPVEVLPATLDARLPNTGSDTSALLLAAALALGLGATAVIRTRRTDSGA